MGGRPEKAKERKMKPPVQVLFPIGLAGGPSRDIKKAAEEGKVASVEIAFFRCPECGHVGPEHVCPVCGTRKELLWHCPPGATSITPPRERQRSSTSTVRSAAPSWSPTRGER